MPKTDRSVTQAIKNIRSSMGFMNEELRSDIELLISAYEQKDEVGDLEKAVRAVLSRAMDQVGDAVAEVRSQPRRTGNPTGRRRRTIEDVEVSEAEKDEYRLRLLEAKHNGEEAYELAVREVQKLLGMQNCVGKNRTVGSMFAHTQGSFQPQFIKRVLGRLEGDDRRKMVDRLSKALNLPKDQIDSVAQPTH